MLDFSDLDSPDPQRHDLAYLRLLEELLGPDWVEWWARERGKLEALREWRSLRSSGATVCLTARTSRPRRKCSRLQ
jgi:hypothetical protein